MRDVLRKIRRNKLRYSLVVILFALSISMITIVGNIEASDVAYSKMVQEKYSLADIVIRTDFGLNEDILQEVRNLEHVEKAELNIIISGFNVINESYVTFILYGMSEERTLNKPIVDAKAWESFKGNVCFIDYRMAEKLNLTVGDEIEVFTKNGSIKLKVVSLVDAQWTLSFCIPLQVVLFTPIDTLKSFLNVNTYNVLYVMSDNMVDKKELADKIVKIIEDKGIKVLGRSILTNTQPSALSVMTMIFAIFMIPTTIMSAVLLAVTLMYEVIRDFRYYGIMKALGYTNRQIILKIYQEALILFLISIPLAIIFSILITKFAMFIFFREMLGEIPVVINYGTFGISVLINLGVLLIFTMVPASKILRINEAEAIRWGFERYSYKPTRAGNRFPTCFLLAMRNLLRNKKKLALIVILLIVGSSLSFSLTITSKSLASKISNSLNDNVDITIIFRNPVDKQEIMKIENISGVKSVDPSILIWMYNKNITLESNVYNGSPPTIGTSYYVLLFLPKSTKVFKPDMIAGRLPSSPNEVALLSKIALYFGIKVGDTLRIKINGLNISVCVRVVGIVNEMYSNALGFIFLDEVIYNAGVFKRDMYNTAFIKLEENANADDVVKELIGTRSQNVAVIIIENDVRESIRKLVVKSIVVFLNTLSIIVFLMVIVGISLFFFMSYVSRLREIALFVSLGATKGDLIRLMLSEGLIMYLLAIMPTLIIGYLMPVEFVNLINKSTIPVYGIVSLSIIDIILLALIPLITVVASIPLILVYISKQNLSEFLRAV